jgi:DNA excision repair protein ERCC-4
MNATNQSFNITVDDRERKSAVAKSLLEMQDVAVRFERLSIGDYQAENRLLFERKTLKDFAASIIDGRLFDQMIRLANSDLTGILILEGPGRDLSNSAMRRESIQGALISTSLILGIPVLRSKDTAETARLILYATRQMKSFVRGGLNRHGYRPKNKRKRQLFILQGLPGIGRERAVRLLNKFGSVEAVITAGKHELQAVAGIGENIAAGIKSAVEEQISTYGFDEEFPI